MGSDRVLRPLRRGSKTRLYFIALEMPRKCRQQVSEDKGKYKAVFITLSNVPEDRGFEDLH